MKHSKIYLERIAGLQKILKKEKIGLFLIEKPTDLFYFTGLHFSLAHLYIDSHKATLFVDGRYFEVAKKNSPVPVAPLKPENESELLKGVKSLAFDGDAVTYSRYLQIKKLCTPSKTKPVSDADIIKMLRLIKGEDEIEKMKRAAAFGYKAYQALLKELKPGVTEMELAKKLEIYCLEHGAEKMSFDPIIAFGPNSSLPHHHPGLTRLKQNEIVLFDLGVVLEDYCSDMTRVVFVGKEDPELKKIFDVNRAAQKAALAKCRPGVTLKEVDNAARKVMAKEGLEKYFVHGLGHGIGLEVHEYPRLNKMGPDKNVRLEAGMAITIEPGLYLPGKGGVRYEDTIIITPDGYMNLYPPN